ncbi:MAG: GTP 3',8-cyclase MoaA [Eubacteriales bacterium]
MNDQSGRKIEYLRLSVTDLCNYRCTYCMGEEGVPQVKHTDILSISELAEIGRAAVACGIKKIRLTGGEPLVRKGIIDLCHMLRAIPELEELTLTTNGSLLPEYAKALKAVGVDRINISIDTLDETKFHKLTRSGHLSDALAGLTAAKEAGFSNLKINTVLIGGFNLDDIPNLIALTKDEPISVRFIELMPIGECADWDQSRFVSADAVLGACPSLVPLKTDGVAELYQVPEHIGTIGLIRPMTHSFCGECNRIRVTTDGRLKPCLHSPAEINLRGLHGTALISALKKGIFYKPAEHFLNENGKSSSLRGMNQIGG